MTDPYRYFEERGGLLGVPVSVSAFVLTYTYKAINTEQVEPVAVEQSHTAPNMDIPAKRYKVMEERNTINKNIYMQCYNLIKLEEKRREKLRA